MNRRAAIIAAARRVALLLAAVSLTAGTAHSIAAAEAPRAAPTRPVTSAPAPATRKFAGVDYVNATDVAERLGLKYSWQERGRKARLSATGASVELERDSRETLVNGLRVFLGDPVVDAGGQLYVSRVDFERCLAPLLRPGYGVAPLRAPRTIVLDPGHGGKDNGTSAHEKTYALDVARRVRKILEAAGYRVVLTRDADTYLDLPERAEIANTAGASLFASIHFNAVPKDTQTSGVELYTFAPQFQRSTSSWGVPKGDDTEKDAAPVNRFDHWSVVLAQAIHRRFVVDLKSFDRGKKVAHWGVLRGLNCPGVLIECGFLTSEVEARKIATPAHREKLAQAVAAGIRDYVATVETARAKNAATSKSYRRRPAGR